MESFSTFRLPASRKVAFWNEITSDTFAALEIEPRDAAHFDGTLSREQVGPVTLMEVCSASVRVRHTRAHIARTPNPSYLLLAPLQREFELTLDQTRSVTVHAGEFCLIDHAREYQLLHGDAVRTLCIDVPRRIFEERIPHTQPLIGRVMRPDNAMSRMLTALLHGLGHELEISMAAHLSAAFGHTLLDFIAATYLPYSETASGRGSKARARTYRAYIDSRLSDSELKPADVAANFRISERYLRAVLQTDGESFSAYLLRRRLERCAGLLRDPVWSHSTITEVALRSGFNNATHFGHAFKTRHGVTPRQYRTRA